MSTPLAPLATARLADLDLARVGPLLVGVTLLLWAAVLPGVLSRDSAQTVNQLAPFAVLLGCGGTAGFLVLRHRALFWSPLVWFLIAAAVYFGFGAMLYEYADFPTVRYAQSYYRIDSHGLYRTNVLNAAGIGFVCLGFAATAFVVRKKRTGGQWLLDIATTERLLTVLLVLAIPAKYLVALPLAFVSSTDSAPGFISAFGQLTEPALIVMVVLVAGGRRRWRTPLYAFVGVELLAALSTLYKMDILRVGIAVIMGLYLARARLKVLLLGLLVGALVYVASVGLVDYGRSVAYKQRGRTTVTERIETSLGYFDADAPLASQPKYLRGVKRWWARLSYANAQGFAMDAYDRRKPGRSLTLAAYTLIPRFIWPEKPRITVGAEFNYLVTGNRDSSSGPGMFGEAYWNGGWPAVALLCFGLGVAFALLTRETLGALARCDLRWLPCMMLTIFAGYRLDAFFVPTFIGPLSYAIMFIVILYLFAVPRTTGARMQASTG